MQQFRQIARMEIRVTFLPNLPRRAKARVVTIRQVLTMTDQSHWLSTTCKRLLKSETDPRKSSSLKGLLIKRMTSLKLSPKWRKMRFLCRWFKTTNALKSFEKVWLWLENTQQRWSKSERHLNGTLASKAKSNRTTLVQPTCQTLKDQLSMAQMPF